MNLHETYMHLIFFNFSKKLVLVYVKCKMFVVCLFVFSFAVVFTELHVFLSANSCHLLGRSKITTAGIII